MCPGRFSQVICGWPDWKVGDTVLLMWKRGEQVLKVLVAELAKIDWERLFASKWPLPIGRPLKVR